MFKTRGLLLVALVLAGGLSIGAWQAAPVLPHGEWRFYSSDNAATKYSPLDQIDKLALTSDLAAAAIAGTPSP